MSQAKKHPIMVDLSERVPAPHGKPHRWHVVVTYRRESGTEVVTYDLEELWDLHMRVEMGFDFLCIESILVTLNDARKGDYDTLEESWRR